MKLPTPIKNKTANIVLLLLIVSFSTFMVIGGKETVEEIGTIEDIVSYSTSVGFLSQSTSCIFLIDGIKISYTGDVCDLKVGDTVCEYGRTYFKGRIKTTSILVASGATRCKEE